MSITGSKDGWVLKEINIVKVFKETWVTRDTRYYSRKDQAPGKTGLAGNVGVLEKRYPGTQ